MQEEYANKKREVSFMKNSDPNQQNNMLLARSNKKVRYTKISEEHFYEMINMSKELYLNYGIIPEIEKENSPDLSIKMGIGRDVGGLKLEFNITASIKNTLKVTPKLRLDK